LAIAHSGRGERGEGRAPKVWGGVGGREKKRKSFGTGKRTHPPKGGGGGGKRKTESCVAGTKVLKQDRCKKKN